MQGTPLRSCRVGWAPPSLAWGAESTACQRRREPLPPISLSNQDASAFAGDGEELSFLQLQARASSVQQVGQAGTPSTAQRSPWTAAHADQLAALLMLTARPALAAHAAESPCKALSLTGCLSVNQASCQALLPFRTYRSRFSSLPPSLAPDPDGLVPCSYQRLPAAGDGGESPGKPSQRPSLGGRCRRRARHPGSQTGRLRVRVFTLP